MNRMYQDQVMMKSHLFFQVAMIGFRDFDCRFSLGGSMYVDLDWFDGFDLLIDCFIGCLGWIQILIFPWLDSNHWVIHKTCPNDMSFVIYNLLHMYIKRLSPGTLIS